VAPTDTDRIPLEQVRSRRGAAVRKSGE
jgi:hypothetical protein